MCLLFVFGIPASDFRIRVSAFDYQDLEFRNRIPRSQFGFSGSSSFGAWLPTNRATDIAARPPPGRLQTGGARAERPRPLPDYAQNDHSA